MSSIWSRMGDVLGLANSKKHADKKRSKSSKTRQLRIESLEKRELLSVTKTVTFEDSGIVLLNLTQDSSNQRHWMTFEAGGKSVTLSSATGGKDNAVLFVEAGQQMSYTFSDDLTDVQHVGNSLSGEIQVEDWTDYDYNDFVVSYDLLKLSVGVYGPHEDDCCTCCCSDHVENTATTYDPGNYVSDSPENGTTTFLVESQVLSKVDIQSQEKIYPKTLAVTLTMGDETQTVYYDTSGFNADDLFSLGMQLDTSELSTGQYDWTIELVYEYADSSTQTVTHEGVRNIVNRSESAYGNGLSITGLSYLNLDNDGGIQWVRSDNQLDVWFEEDGNYYTAENGSSVGAKLTADGSAYIIREDGNTYYFNSAGLLLKRETASAVTEIWAYDQDGRVTSKTDGGGNVTAYTYSGGMLASVNEAGRITAYTYDALGRLTSVTQPDPDDSGPLVSPVTTYTYVGDTTQLASVTDAQGIVTTYTYDGAFLISCAVNGVTQYTQTPYLANGIVDLETTGFDANNLAVLTSWDDVNGSYTDIYGKTTVFRNDLFGNVVWQSDLMGKTTISPRDKNSNEISRTETWVKNGQQIERAVTRFEYDSRGNLTKITYPDKTTERWTYDVTYNQVTTYINQLGYTTTYTIDPSTGLTTAIGYSTAAGYATTSYTYDSARRLTSVTDAEGMVTTYTYDVLGNVSSITVGDGTPLAATTYYTYNAHGEVTSTTDADGNTTNFTYDNLGRLLVTTYPPAAANATRLTTRNVYNAKGQLAQTVDEYGNVTAYTYDNNGRVTLIEYPDPDGSGPGASSTLAMTYNTIGQLIAETDSLGLAIRYAYSDCGKLIASYAEDTLTNESVQLTATTYDHRCRVATETDAAGVTLRYTYNSMSRVTQVVRTNDVTTIASYTYDSAGQVKTIKDALGNTTSYTYDQAGSITRITTADGAVTQFAYDKTGRLLSTTDALNNVTYTTYNILGDLIYIIDAEENTTTYTYSATGELLTETDALGNVTTYDYDNLGRLISTTITSANGLESTSLATTYGTMTVAGATWQRITTTDSLNHSTTSIYDAAGRLVQTIAADGATTNYTYDSEDQLLTVTDALNQTTTYIYDYLGNNTQIILADNTVYSYVYNAAGQLLSEIDPLGVSTLYTYDYGGNVTKVTTIDPTVTQSEGSWLEEGKTFNGTSTTVNLGNPAELNFTGEITLAAWVKIEGSTTGFHNILAHGAAGNREVFLRVYNGCYEIGTWDGGATSFKAIATVPAEDIGQWVHLVGTYDGIAWNLYKNGELVATSASTVGAITVAANWYIGSANGSSRYFKGEISDVGMWSSALSAAEIEALYSGAGSGRVTTTATYNTAGWLTSVTDANGNATTYTYDVMGRVLSVTDALSHVTAYTYDKLGRLISETDPLGLQTVYTYDAVGNLLQTTQIDTTALPDPVGHWLDEAKTYNKTNSNLGNPANLNFSGEITISAWVKADSITNQFNNIIGHGSASNREVFLRIYNGNYEIGVWDGGATSYKAVAAVPAEDIGQWVHLVGTYDGTHWNLYRNGELLASVASTVGAITVPGNWFIGSDAWSSRYFTGDLRDINIYNESLDASQVATLYNRDTANVTTYTYDGLGQVTSVTDALGNTTTYEYNYLGLVTTITDALSGEYTTTYDAIGRVTSESDPLGNETLYTYDARGRLLTATDAEGGVTTYTYDLNGQLLSLTDSVGNTTSYVYNSVGLVIEETNALNASRYYTYDEVGQLIELVDRNGRVTQYAYDFLGRQVSEQWFDSNDNAIHTYTYAYDAVGNLLYAGDATTSYTYTYDEIYRLLSSTFVIENHIAVFDYSYNVAERKTQSTLTLDGIQQRVLDMDYDFLGRTTSLHQHGDALDDLFAEFDYNALGQVTQVTRKEGLTATDIAITEYLYDELNRLSSINHAKPDTTSLVSHSYDYDAASNIIQYLNSLDGSTSYTYDATNQLTSADSATTDETYTYDANGNRISANGSSYTTGLNNQLLDDGTYTYTYDAEGNRLSKTHNETGDRTLYEYDHRNRLIRIIDQAYDSNSEGYIHVQIVEYAYAYNNVWVRKLIDTNSNGGFDEKTLLIPEGYQTVLQLEDTDLSDNANAQVTHIYLWTPGTQDQLLADSTSEGVLWALVDHLGSVRDIVEKSGNDIIIVAHVVYDAYGNIIDGTNPILFGYTGKAFDADTQLQNNINRWYDSTIGRWLTTDPISFNGGDANLYRYVGNKTILATDPLGLADALHHIYPLYLGGPSQQTLMLLDSTQHTKFHSILAKKGFAPGDAGRTAWKALSPGMQKLYILKSLREAGVSGATLRANIHTINDIFLRATPGVANPRQYISKAVKPIMGKMVKTGAKTTLRVAGKAVTYAIGPVSVFCECAFSTSTAYAAEIPRDWRGNDTTLPDNSESWDIQLKIITTVEQYRINKGRLWNTYNLEQKTYATEQIDMGKGTAAEALFYENQSSIIEETLGSTKIKTSTEIRATLGGVSYGFPQKQYCQECADEKDNKQCFQGE